MVSRADRATRETEYVVAQYFKLLVSKPSFGPSPHSLLSVPISGVVSNNPDVDGRASRKDSEEFVMRGVVLSIE